MMDRNTIKDKGILEQYLLGELSEEQSKEIENILKEDQDLREYYTKMEDDMERMTIENAISPPAQVKTDLLKQVENSGNTPKKKALSLAKEKRQPYNFAIAASLAALFLMSSGWLYNKWQNTEQTMITLQQETNYLKNRLVNLEGNYKETDRWYQAINKPEVIQLVLKGNQKSPNSAAIAYVNHQDKEVILNAKGLSKLHQDKTYQMWADVDGEMIDMGVIPSDKEMIVMKYIEKTESLNITIEPAGGNDHPTVEQLISNVIL
ncbi:anti-sigma factor domain-containing protein [Aquimarina sp. SS2-1]|uniref:anti-sigma factor n=1 Tax=Aquimarina besae TaxID=3342247 RepID=UPI00366ADE4A